MPIAALIFCTLQEMASDLACHRPLKFVDVALLDLLRVQTLHMPLCPQLLLGALVEL